MTYVTRDEAVSASRTQWRSSFEAKSMIVKAARAPITTTFDVFLSHAYEDAEVIAGVKVLLERERLSVYVDWIEDSQADRSAVTAATADLLRERMKHCSFLLYASSKSSSSSKWMPWELGYFDGMRSGHVGILPIVQQRTSGFLGQEYLGLYPTFEYIDFEGLGRRLGRWTGPREGQPLKRGAI